MARFFISYSRVDRPVVNELIPHLREVYGFDQIWFDENIHGGQLWWDEILRQISICHVFIFLLSDASVGSSYCIAEMNEAQRLNKPVLPVLVRARTKIPDEISKIQYIDFSPGISPNALAKLIGAMRKLSNESALLRKPRGGKITPPSVTKYTLDERERIQLLKGLVEYQVVYGSIFDASDMPEYSRRTNRTFVYIASLTIILFILGLGAVLYLIK